MNSLGKIQDRRKKIITAAAFIVLLLLQLAVLFYYGNRKSGFHEDEFYSYYSTNKTAGLFVNDRQWLSRDSFRNDFVVLEGEQFRYQVVKQMQSWDVHPPLYYYILHTVCSLFPGVFSKWLGIGVNILAYIPGFCLLAYLVYRCLLEEEPAGVSAEAKEKNRRYSVFMAFAVCLFWGFSAAVISGVMFIRMYQWLTLFVLLLACLHIRAIKKQDFGIGFLIPTALTVFLGFMTQYYYIIFHFFMGVGMCFLFFKSKKIKELFLYALSCAAGLLAAIIYYPSSMAHIFRGYRGTEAVSEFGNAGNTLERLRFFTGLFDDYVVNGWLCVWLLCICLAGITVYWIKRRPAGKPDTNGLSTRQGQETKQAVLLLLFSCAGYFFTVSKTALLLGETSNRYQLPVYGILLFLLLYFLCTPVSLLIKKDKWKPAAGLILLGAVLLTDGTALKNGKVFFLYEEEKQTMEYVKENRDVPVVVFYNEASPDNVWRLSDELMEFPEVYLASQGNREEITDNKISDSSKLLVYVADYDNQEECLLRLLQSNENLSSFRVIAEKELWTLYEMN
ncbi:MAG: hypothetical protein J6C64_08565 [Lachnospiraceae bacterium]|nr:hypothetical protein [Lachnospiraceae bacterium]